MDLNDEGLYKKQYEGPELLPGGKYDYVMNVIGVHEFEGHEALYNEFTLQIVESDNDRVRPGESWKVMYKFVPAGTHKSMIKPVHRIHGKLTGQLVAAVAGHADASAAAYAGVDLNAKLAELKATQWDGKCGFPVRLHTEGSKGQNKNGEAQLFRNDFWQPYSSS